jgi:hypothetical protein
VTEAGGQAGGEVPQRIFSRGTLKSY